MTSIEDYRRGVISRHKAAFDFYGEVAGLLETHITSPKERTGVVRLTLDMLLVQSSKAHAGVALLAQHGLMEDTATLTRRLLELSVQSVYIGAEEDPRLQKRKAGKFIAFMWRELPTKVKHRLPKPIRDDWSGFARSFARFVPQKAKSWAPSWRDMFEEVGSEKLYRRDYSFLSGIAHGRSDHQIIQYSQNPIRVHSDQFVSVLLIWATRFYLVAAWAWNREFKQVPEDELARLVRVAATWKFKKQPSALRH